MSRRDRFVRRSKDRIKEFLCRRLHVEFNSIGLPVPLARRLERGRPIVLLDVGAFEGWFARVVSQYCGLTKCVMVEPIPHRAESLRRHFALPQYEVFCCAVSDREGVVSFETNAQEATSSMLPMLRDLDAVRGTMMECPPTATFECSTRRLDSISEQARLTNIDLLKIDVQGAEHLVLDGAHDTLARTRLVWVEVSFRPLYAGSTTFAPLYERFDALGFSLIDLEPGFRSRTGELLQADALFVRRDATPTLDPVQ
ncbi:MAG TPA: FkbM family methyltransferase [Pirellulales bacterium]|jgi:FkbM family methyltransferase|nr:FkbM family methyltransferase [Pirellulales bacterium]